MNAIDGAPWRPEADLTREERLELLADIALDIQDDIAARAAATNPTAVAT